MFSINILRFAKRSASVRPPLSFKYGDQYEDKNKKLKVDKNYLSKKKSDGADKNIFSREIKESKTLTNSDEQKVDKNIDVVNFEKLKCIKKEKIYHIDNCVSNDGKVNFVSSDLMQVNNKSKENTRKDLLKKSYKAEINFGYKEDIVFGIHPVLLALQSNRRKIYEIFYKKGSEIVNKKIHEILLLAQEMEIKITASTKKDINRIVGGDRVHQGVCCHASVLPSAVIDGTVYSCSSRNDEDNIHNKNEYYLTLMTENLDTGNTIENTKKNCIFNGHLQTNNIDRHLEENQVYSKMTHSDMLKSHGKLEKSTLNSLSKVNSVEVRTISCSNESNNKQLWIYLDSVHDPMNLGAILRSSYFLGIDKVFVSQENSCRISGVVSKASAGVAEIMQVYQVTDPMKFVRNLKAAGWCTVVATASNDPRAVSVSTFTPMRNTFILIGNEGTGVNEFLSQLCDTAVTILPRRQLHPAVDSLNVSVATALLLHTITSKMN